MTREDMIAFYQFSNMVAGEVTTREDEIKQLKGRVASLTKELADLKGPSSEKVEAKA